MATLIVLGTIKSMSVRPTMKGANWCQSSHDHLDRQDKYKKDYANSFWDNQASSNTVYYNFHSNAVYGVSNVLGKKCLRMNETSIIYQIAC
jgi:hypothetical protein